MMNYFLRIAFRGRDFYGTQKLSGKPTVQALLEKTLSGIFDSPIKVKVGSRLDRGVSALDLGANFKVSASNQTPDHLKYVLNRLLPPVIRIKSIKLVSEDFNARYDALRKTYLYIIEKKDYNPLLVDFCWHPVFDFDSGRLAEVSQLFVGTHCFDSFGSEPQKSGRLLSIENIRVEMKKNYILWRVTGRSFLRYQVRFMIGTAYETATGCLQEKYITDRLDGMVKETSRYKAPASGLILENVDYDFERGDLNA